MPLSAQNQSLPTAGTDFWLGFMQNAYGAQALRVHISSQSGASGTVSMPLAGWSSPFSVGANGTVTVDVPLTAEHIGSESVQTKSVRVQSDNAITVAATSYQSFTSDAARVLPVASIGTSYRAQGYRGLPGFAEFYKSELLIVATADGTELTITPSVNTSGGHAAGVPFNIILNTGETYQVQGALAALDITGTTVTGTPQSGPCRPFAVFSGSMCANVPVSCPACDHLFEQMVPTDRWGTAFHSVDINNTTNHTLRILAEQNGTQVSVNGAPPVNLNAGQVLEQNTSTAACITATLPVSVVQLMEGFNCAGTGDPSMIELVPDAGLSTSASFRTMISAQITGHAVSVIMPTASVGQLTLDGSTVSAALFQSYPGCAGYSRARFAVTAGTHTLAAAGGFIAYATGTGTGESYALNVSNVAAPTAPPPSVICSSDPITIGTADPIINAEWTLASDPGTVIATGPWLTFTPTINDTYVLDGELPVSGCPKHYEWQVGVPAQLVLDITADGLPSGDICQFGSVQLNATPAPDPNIFDVTWTPSAPLSDATIPNPIAYPMSDTWFRMDVVSPVGCGAISDSVFVNVTPSDLYDVAASTTDPEICAGDATTLQARAERVVMNDLFEGSLSSDWASVIGGTPSTLCGALSGSALRFDAAGVRRATTGPMDMSTGSALHFGLIIGASAAPCDDAEPGDDVLVEYSNDGVAWNMIAVLNEMAYPSWTMVDLPLPAGALTPTTRFRWSQPNNSGTGTDNWAIDNVVITRFDNTGISFNWTPTNGLTSPNWATTNATPTSSTTFTITAQNAAGCSRSDDIHITVAPAFVLDAGSDTTVCSVGTPVTLHAVPGPGSGISYAWSPNDGSIDNAAAQHPVATPSTTTTYSVTATTDIGCTAQADMTITVGQLQSVTVSATDTQLCFGETTQLSAVVIGLLPSTIAWSPDNGTLNAPNSATTGATPNAPTVYSATVTEIASGCTMSEAIAIAVSPDYVVDLGPDVTICSTLGFQLNAVHNVPAPQILWSNGGLLNDDDIQAPTIMFDTTATYSVIVTDAFGCSATDEVTITDPFDMLITPVNLDACEGEALVLDAQFPGCTYLWNTNATTQTITVNVSGTYICTITDPQGCVAVKTYYVTFDAVPDVDLGPDQSLCGATSFTLDANSPGNSVLWSTNEATQQITVTQSNTYSVSVTTPAGCSAADELLVTFNSSPTDQLQDVSACTGSSPVLDAGNPGCTYLWSNGAVTQSIAVDQSGAYSVTITTAQQCAGTFDAIVTLLPLVEIDLGPDTSLCTGGILVLDAGTQGLAYQWSNGAQSQSTSVTVSGTYSLTATNGSCTGSDTIEVVFLSMPVDVLVDETSCVDDPVTLDAGNNGCTYLWSTNEVSQQITVAAGGTVSVTVTTPENCSSTFDALVTFVGYPMVVLGQDTVLCEGDVLDIDAGNPGASFQWNTGEQTQVISVDHSGEYSVLVDNGYCVGSGRINAIFNPRPNRLLTHQHYACLEDEPHYVVISAGNPGSTYDWSTGESSQVILAGAYGWYYVSVTNQYDCTVADSAVVNEFCPPSIYVPNTFTPNGDGVNDVWSVAGKSIGHFEMNVFDRWGAVIFHSEDPSLGWDGRINGTEAPNDVYVWRMEYKFIEQIDGDQGVNHKQLGHVTIMR